MLELGGGASVNTSSNMGLVGWAKQCGYSASKHGIVGLTKTAAIEYARKGIRINAVCPGTIDSQMGARLSANDPEVEQQIIDQTPIGRVGRAHEIAGIVVGLCSDAASFVVGTIW